jgi:hypothetical protein
MAKRIIECQVNDEYVVGAGVPIGASGSHDDVVLRLKFNDTWDGLYIYATFRDALGGHPTVVLLLPTMLVDGKARTYDVTIPAAAKLYNGKATVTLTGYLTKQEQTEDGIERTAEASVTNTATAYFPVLPSNYVVADDGSVDPTLAQQLQREISLHEKNVSEELEGIRASVDAETEDHKTQVAQMLAEHEAQVAENLRAQDEEINGAVLTATEAERIANEVKARADAGEFKGDPGKKGDKGDPGSIKFIIVTELPEEDIDESAIYLVPSENPSEDNKFIEYFYANGRWEMLPGGGVTVDLTNYATKKFVEDGFVAKGTSPDENFNGVYGVTADGTQTIFKASAGQSANKIALTDGYGCLYVAEPKFNSHAASKQYVDKLFNSIVNGEEVAY